MIMIWSIALRRRLQEVLQICQLLVICLFTDTSKLPRNDLRLPFGIKPHAQHRAALIAEEQHRRPCSLRCFVAGSYRLDDNRHSALALRALSGHHDLLYRTLPSFPPGATSNPRRGHRILARIRVGLFTMLSSRTRSMDHEGQKRSARVDVSSSEGSRICLRRSACAPGHSSTA